jgi:hypothetical protein
MMVMFYLIGSLEREREREKRELCPPPIETFFCQSNLFVFIDNTWDGLIKWLMNYHFWIWGFQVSTHVGRFFDFVKNLWFLVFVKKKTLEIKGNLSGSSFFFWHQYIQNHLNIFKIKNLWFSGIFWGVKEPKVLMKEGKNQQRRVSSLMTRFFDFLNPTSTYSSKV